MNSTEQIGPHDQVIRKFFKDVVMPLRQTLFPDGQALFPLRGDCTAESYFTVRAENSMSQGDFEICSGIVDSETLLAAFEALWLERQNPALVTIAPQLARLAEILKSDEKQSEEVSPHVYVMY